MRRIRAAARRPTLTFDAVLNDRDLQDEPADAFAAPTLEAARRRLIVRRLPSFATAWAGATLAWVLVLALESPDVLLPGLAILGAQVLLLVGVGARCRRNPTARFVTPAVAGACAVLGASSTALFVVARAESEVLAFVLLSLFLASALLFAWGWRAQLVVLLTTLAAAAPALPMLGASIPRLAFATAVLVGAAVALAIAEGSARAFATAFIHRARGEQRTRELEASRDAYRDLAENARDFVYAGDLAGRITYVNETFARFTGRPVAAIVGARFHDLIAPHPDNPDLDAMLAWLGTGGNVPPLTFAMHTAEGPRWVEVLPSAVGDRDGRAVGVRGIGRDVTDRTRAAEALRESEERFRSAFDSASIGMVVVDIDGCATQVNAAFCAMVGYDEAELLGVPFGRVTHPDDIEATAALASAALAGGAQSYHLEKRYRHRLGYTVWGHLSSALLRDARGQPLYFISQIQDITERKHAEDALRESEERYRNLVETQDDLVARFDLDGRYTFVNDAYCRTFGLGRDEIVGRPIVDFLHPDDIDATRVEIAGVTLAARRGGIENRQRTAAGWRWISWEGCAITDECGRTVEIQSVGRDVTERRTAEEALRASLEELRRSEERLRLLAQRQSRIREEERKRLGFDLHDNICQELVGIAILVESMRRRFAPLPSAADADLDRVVRYLQELVEHLRVLARDLRPMLLRDLGLEGSLRSLADGMASTGTTVRAEFPTSIPRLDEEIELAVYRIAQEALANASRHAAARTIVVTLTVDARYLRLVVRDDGRGFDLAAPSEALGLVSMRERALALGGRFEVTSAPGEGTVVHLECPLVSRAAA